MAETPDKAGPTQLTTSEATIVTAGAGSTWTLVRKIIITNVSNAPVNVTVGIGTTNTDTAAKRILDRVTIQPGTPFIEDGFSVLKGGASPDLLYAFADTGSAANIYVALVTGP